ncbi:MAG: DUF4375 domain-containing protein [Myxococcota bacterium]
MPIVVTRQALDAEDPYDVVQSNIGIVNRLRDAWLNEDEIDADAWRSYLVDYFGTQVRDGGFSQFVYSSTWREAEVKLVRGGLEAMGAHDTLGLFDRGVTLVDELPDEELEAFLESATHPRNATRDRLQALDVAFGELDEDLEALNAAWIRSRTDLVVLADEDVETWIAEQIDAIENLEDRIAAAQEAEPRYAKAIRRLLDAVGLELGRITAGDPAHEHEGRTLVAWHFLTADDEPYYQLDFGTEAAMFDAETHDEVVRVDVADLP